MIFCLKTKNQAIVASVFGWLFVFILLVPSNAGIGKTGNGESSDNTTLSTDMFIFIEPVAGLVKQDQAVKAGILYDASQNKVVWSKGMTETLPIASLTKMMVGLIAAEELKKGNITWETTVEATKEAELISSSKIWMKRGHTFTVYELVKSFMISSANDACYLTAQFLGGGTEAGFVVLMNNKAKELGMLNTHFGNSTGLPAPAGMKDNMSTPFDMLLLVRELLKYPEIVEISGRHGESVHNGTLKCELKNHNKLAIEYCEIDGLKTGFTRRAGFCLAATAEKGDTRLVAIVLGAQSPMLRNNFVAQVFNSYYDNYLGMGKLQKQSHSLNNHLSKAETILINNEGN